MIGRDKRSISLPMLPLIKRDLVDEEGSIRYEPVVPVVLEGVTPSMALQDYALIDTTAEICMVSQELAKEIQSASIGNVQLASGIGGTLQADYYYLGLIICDQEFNAVAKMGRVRFLSVEFLGNYSIVLGQQGFLENVNNLRLDYVQRQLTIEFKMLTQAEATEEYLAEAKSLMEAGNYFNTILSLYYLIEGLLMDVLRIVLRISLDEKRTITIGKAGQMLHRAQIIDNYSLKLLDEFVNLRDNAVHTHTKEPVTRSQALRGIQLARPIIESLKSTDETSALLGKQHEP